MVAASSRVSGALRTHYKATPKAGWWRQARPARRPAQSARLYRPGCEVPAPEFHAGSCLGFLSDHNRYVPKFAIRRRLYDQLWVHRYQASRARRLHVFARDGPILVQQFDAGLQLTLLVAT